MPPMNGVKIRLDKMRRLRYTNRSLVRLEEEVGLTVQQAGHRVEIGSLRALSALVWAGLLHEDPDLSREDALDLIDLQRMEEIGEAVKRALEAAFGTDKGEEEEEDDPKKGGPEET
jgi:hypothetical protein